MVLNGETINLILVKTFKNVMKIVIKNTYLKFEVGFDHSENLHDIHNYLPLLPSGVCNQYNIKEYILLKRTLKQTLNYVITLKKRIE